MQLYRVKLNEGHSAKPEQIAAGYLGNYSTVDPALYTEREAKKKAKMFGGSIEKFGIEYTVDKINVIQIPKHQLSQALVDELNGREVFADTDTQLGELMYCSDVFEAILGEQYEYFEKQTLIRVGKEYQVLVDELMALDEICRDSQYVMVTTI
jgi:hypothetical protein